MNNKSKPKVKLNLQLWVLSWSHKKLEIKQEIGNKILEKYDFEYTLPQEDKNLFWLQSSKNFQNSLKKVLKGEKMDSKVRETFEIGTSIRKTDFLLTMMYFFDKQKFMMSNEIMISNSNKR